MWLRYIRPDVWANGLCLASSYEGTPGGVPLGTCGRRSAPDSRLKAAPTGLPSRLGRAESLHASRRGHLRNGRSAGSAQLKDGPASIDHLCRLTGVRCSISRTRSQRSRRCHNVWHMPRSNWMRRESTGTHFTLKPPKLGTVSVVWAWFKSPLAHSFRANVTPSQRPVAR
jgi:hypothetical protein